LSRKYEQAGIKENRLGLSFRPAKGKIVPDQRLRADVETHLRNPDVKAVVVLTDVYPDYSSAQEAKQVLSEALDNEGRCNVHVACHDFEAWLLPYWEKICRIVGQDKKPFGANPELVNAMKPPSLRLAELYSVAKPRPMKYTKPSQAFSILRGEDIEVSAKACPELKSFINTILGLAGLQELQ
jgi:hypothetical protein